VLFGVVVNYAAGTSISLQLSACSFRDHVRAQVPGVLLALLAAAIALPTRMALHAAGAPPPVVLALTALAAAAGLAGLVFFFPDFIGEYGRMAIRLSAAALSGRLPSRRLAWLEGLSRSVVRRWLGTPDGSKDQITP